MWIDGRVYHGMWKDGVQHGEGVTVNPNMKMTKALWECGKEISPLELSATEREEVKNYVQNMLADRQKMLEKGEIRRSRTSNVSQSRNFERTRQLSSQARQSMGSSSRRGTVA